ncbi:MAG: hypothetical protein KKD73_04795 [Proteobacteria bacterium]|nr:hypothetical protein [Pseudomonadota bacterium]MBU1639397.1 hypothetical protein [Pseudomonadota bacterium]
MEYLLVVFADKRRVIIDEVDTGQHTDEVIELEAGHHDITLSGPKDFMPEIKSVVLQNSTVLNPLEVGFAKK